MVSSISTKSVIPLSQPKVEQLSLNAVPSSTPVIITTENSALASSSINRLVADNARRSSHYEKGHNGIHHPPDPVDMNEAKKIVAMNAECCTANFNCLTMKLSLPDAATIVYN